MRGGDGWASRRKITVGEYQIDGGAWTSAAGTVTSGQAIKVRHTSAATGGTATQTTLTIGGASATFISTTLIDGAPDAFSFTNQTDVATGAIVESDAITVAGLNIAAAITITVGEYQIDGGAWTSAAGTVTSGQAVKVRHTSAATGGTATQTTLTIGGASVTFISTTLIDGAPDAFSFTNQTDVATGAIVESDTTTVAGLNVAAAITITVGEYQIDGGAWTSAAGTVTSGQAVKVRHTSAATLATVTQTALTIGGIGATFRSRTVLPAGYVAQGGLIWTPDNETAKATWDAATTYCTTTAINGQSGWRLPTVSELQSLQAFGAAVGRGWALGGIWSSTPGSPGYHYFVAMSNGAAGLFSDVEGVAVSCVR